MEGVICSLCGKELDEKELCMCMNCGALVCTEDYDEVSNLCSNCCENGQYCQC